MRLIERRRPGLDRVLVSRVTAVWLAVCLVNLLIDWQSAAALPATYALRSLGLGLVILLTARIAWRVAGAATILPTALLAGLLQSLFFPLSGSNDAVFIWQTIAILAAANGLAARSETGGARIAGMALGLGASLSLTLLPVAMVFAALLALRWLHAPGQRVWLTSFMPALVAGSGCGWAALEVALGGSGSTCDGLSLLHLAGLSLVAALIAAMARMRQSSGLVLVGGFTVIGAGGVSALFFAQPVCPVGSHALPALLTTPLWHLSLADAALLGWPPLLGCYAAWHRARRSSGWLQRFWTDYGLLLGGLWLCGLTSASLTIAACLLAFVPISAQFGRWIAAARAHRRAPRRFASAFALSLVITPAIPTALQRVTPPAEAKTAAVAEMSRR
jgi:hypothetical protein